ncbi:plastocyanin/azurin family copper-binding protein [Geojedonia litorea]|uniref:Plastocyanin/azurin family copper-binding protein n=1 Tax=Geojedonia litorea TaxID=1268269 RepID=A0ABV9N523_9FLAO
MKTLKNVFTLLMICSIAVGCGGEKKKEEDASSKVKIKSAETSKSDDNVANIVITADDLMKFNTNEIRVKAGQKVKLTLRHLGKLDKNVMGHNVVILNLGADLGAFAASAATQKENDYIPVGTQDVLVNTKMIGGGETTSIEFTAPAAGVYDFLCSFPAHFALMNGKFIVE